MNRETRPYLWSAFLLLLMLTGINLACGGGGGTTTNTSAPTSPTTPISTTTPQVTLTALSVSPDSASVVAGLTQQFHAQATYSDGSTKNLTAAATWSSSANGVATVDTVGMVTSRTQGTATISAAIGTVSGSAQLTVEPAALTSIAIGPAVSSISRGSAQSFTATGTYTDGSTQNLSSTVSWTIANPYVAIGSLSGTGSAQALSVASQGNGFTTVTASNGTFTSTANLSVVSPSRFVYVSQSSGSLTAFAEDSMTGDLRMRGYQPTRIITEGNPPNTDCVTVDPSGQYAYVVNPGSGTNGVIRIYAVNTMTGAQTEIADSPISTSAPLSCLEFEPSGNFGYAVSRINGLGKLAGYSRDSNTGKLTELAWSPISIGGSPSDPAVDPLGKYLYFVDMEITSGIPTSIYGFSIDSSTGALTAVPGSPLSVSNLAMSVSLHPLGTYAYISNGSGKSIDLYSIDRQTGTLTQVSAGTISTDINPAQLVFGVDGIHAYLVSALNAARTSNTGTLSTFQVDTVTGKLTAISDIAAGTIPSALVVDSSGKFIYTNDSYNYIRIHLIQSDGTPKYVRSIASRTGPITMAALSESSPTAYRPASLFVTTSGDNQLTGYMIANDGSLAKASSIAVPQTPSSLALLPWGTQALVNGITAPSVENLGIYSFDGLAGTSALEIELGNAVVSAGVAIDPSEMYGFESDSAGGVLRTYMRSTNNGFNFWNLAIYIVSPGVPQTTFPAGSGAGPMAMVPSGSYLYVGNQSANTISAFAFWGELFEETSAYTGNSDGSPYSIGASSVALVADPMGLYLYVVCNDKTLRTYSIDYGAAGHLKLVSTANLPAVPTSVAVDATGHFVYVGDASGNVSPFAVDPGSGALTALMPTTLPAVVNGLTLESSGQFAYVICGPQTGTTPNNGMIYAFQVNADGTLTASPAGPYPANNPTAIAYTDTVQ